MREKDKLLQNILDKTVDSKKIFGISFSIKKDNTIWHGTAGDLYKDIPYFIASTTKLFTTAIILYLRSKGKLNIDDRISLYLEPSIVEGLHIYEGIEYSNQITIRHLLAHTSGLSDYFQDKEKGETSWEEELKKGNDREWTFEQAIKRTKKLKPLFIPGTKNKAYYSDSNYQLLGKIIENVTGKSYSQNCDELIINRIGLSKTYLYTDYTDCRPKSLYYKSSELHIPKAMTSFRADGGMVSTSSDMLMFIEAFFTGRLFPLEYISEMQEWNKIFYPMSSGIGVQLFKLPWIFNPFGGSPNFMGYVGLSGSIAFCCPKKNLYIAGTVNQVARPDIALRTMIKLTKSISK